VTTLHIAKAYSTTVLALMKRSSQKKEKHARARVFCETTHYTLGHGYMLYTQYSEPAWLAMAIGVMSTPQQSPSYNGGWRLEASLLTHGTHTHTRTHTHTHIMYMHVYTHTHAHTHSQSLAQRRLRGATGPNEVAHHRSQLQLK